MVKKNKLDQYVVIAKHRYWDFLNGYSCKSESKDHFLRHLGYKYLNKCTIHELNNAYKYNEIDIQKVVIENKEIPIDDILTYEILNEYWDYYSYVLVLKCKSKNGHFITKMEFPTDREAMEWIRNR